ncbi:hypothetical protein [Providencia sp. PROV255]|nr:hypothetical protein [Providencia sp. PROV255]
MMHRKPHEMPQRGNPVPSTGNLRDQFAMAAMQGDWAAQDERSGYFDENSGEATFSKSAEMYYRMADAMMKARGK